MGLWYLITSSFDRNLVNWFFTSLFEHLKPENNLNYINRVAIKLVESFVDNKNIWKVKAKFCFNVIYSLEIYKALKTILKWIIWIVSYLIDSNDYMVLIKQIHCRFLLLFISLRTTF